MEFEYTEQRGSVHGRYTGACLLCLSYGYTNGGFLAIEQTVNPVFQVQTFAAPGR